MTTEVVVPAAKSEAAAAGSALRVPATRARPSKTLFGSVLEQLTEAERRQIAQLEQTMSSPPKDVAWQSVAMRRERPAPAPLPAELAKFLRERHASGLQRHAHQLDEHRRRLKQRERRLNLLERDAKYVLDDPPPPVPPVPSHPLDELPAGGPRWLTKEDLCHADELNPNFMGPGVRNFNRDKYRRQPDVHCYALAGDPMRTKGMDFDGGPALSGEVEQPLLPPAVMARPDRLVLTPRTRNRRQATRRLPPSSQTVAGLQLPMRLVHQFGGAEACEGLLGDREAVLETQRRVQPPPRRPRQAAATAGAETAPTQAPIPITSAYEQLGDALRTNVFGRGRSVDQRVSSNHLDYSRSQLAAREPVPDQYRYQKDHVSRWAEANVLEMRMKKALQERMDRLLHKKADD